MSEDWNYWKLALIGAIGGAVAGVGMWLLMTVVTLIGGQGLWTFPKWVADAVYGDSWLGFNATDVFTGLIIHLLVSIILGALFCVIVVPFAATFRQLLIGGLIWGFVVWVLVGLLAVAATDPTMSQEAPAIPWMLVNLLYGVGVAFVVNPLRSAAEAVPSALPSQTRMAH